MKKFIAIMLSVSAGVIILGFILVAIGGFKTVRYGNFSVINQDRITVKNIEYYDAVKVQEKQMNLSQCKDIRLELVNSQLDIVKTEGSEIRLSYEEYFANEWTYSSRGDTLELRYFRGSDNWLGSIFNFFDNVGNGFDYQSKRHTVKLYLPSDAAVSLKVSSVNGSSNISFPTFESLDLSGVNASYNLSGADVKNDIRLENVNGSFKINNVTAPALDLSSLVNGRCDIDSGGIPSIDANGLVNSSMSIVSPASGQDTLISYHTVSGGVSVDGSRYKGDGEVGARSAKNRISFDGVNSDLTVSYQSSAASSTN